MLGDTRRLFALLPVGVGLFDEMNRWVPGQPLPAALSGLQNKLDRAKHHVAEISSIVEDITSGYSRAVTEAGQDGGVIRYELRGVPVVPVELSAMVGDALHNMRSVLDHLAWELVLRHGGTPTRRTSFPILTRRPGGAEPPRIEGGIGDEARTLLDEVQPYHWRDEGEDPQIHPLEVLRYLNNIDKHNQLLLGVVVLSGASWSSGPDTTASFQRAPGRALADGDMVGSLTVAPADAAVHDLQLDFRVRLVETSEASRYARFDLVEWALGHALNAVEFRVFPRFVPLFE